MDIIEEMKSRVSMRELLESYGIQPVRGTNIYRCLFHSPDKRPSANIIKGCDRFHCFVCNQSWDILDIVQQIEKCDWKTSTKIIDGQFGLGLLGHLTHKEKLEISRKNKLREQEKLKKKQQDQLENNIRKKIVTKIREWQKIEQLTHLTKKEYRNNNWQFSDLYFQSIKEQERLDWLWHKIANRFLWSESEYDYIYGTDKKQVIEKIQNGEIRI